MNIVSLRSIALPAIALLGLSSAAHAVTFLENFNSYTASSTPVTGLTAAPGFGGATGGWAQGWRSSSSSLASTARVLDTNTVLSGGNYFAGTLNTAAATGFVDSSSLGRAYDVAGNSLASATALYVNFDFRVDGINHSTMRFDLYDAAARGTGGGGSTSWEFRSINGNWHAINGANFIATTMPVTAGATYSFAIVMNPATFKWDYTISSGSTSVSGAALNFRAAAFATDATAGSVGARWFTVAVQETTDTGGQTATFSIDNISISTTSPIPEPSSFALLGGAVALVAVATRRRRQ